MVGDCFGCSHDLFRRNFGWSRPSFRRRALNKNAGALNGIIVLHSESNGDPGANPPGEAGDSEVSC